MKLGKVIVDPSSEEAKKLVGKRVVVSSSYKSLSNDDNADYFQVGILREIGEDCTFPFKVSTGNLLRTVGYCYIRGVLEDYVPYDSVTEFLNERVFFYQGLNNKITKKYMVAPIWLKKKGTQELMQVNYLNKEEGLVGVFDDKYTLKGLFNTFTYLDGSPVGKEA